MSELYRSLGADEVVNYTAVDVCQTMKAKGETDALVIDNVGVPAELYKASDEFLLPDGKFIPERREGEV